MTKEQREKRNRVVVTQSILLGMVLTITIIGLGLGFKTFSYDCNHYEKEGYVTFVDDTRVQVTELSGEVWEFTTDKIFHVGEEVEVQFFDNNTDYDIYDDEIVKVEKIEVDK